MSSRKASRSRERGIVLRASVAPCIESLEGRRLLNAGLLDTSFGSGGEVVTSAAPPGAAIVQPDGKVLAYASDGSSVQRFNADGSVDATFHGPTFAPAANTWITGGDLALGSGGQMLIVVPGAAQPVERLNADGSVDASFAPPLPSSLVDGLHVTAVAVQPDGKVIVGADVSVANTFYSTRPVFYRLNADGSLDRTFGSNGVSVMGVHEGWVAISQVIVLRSGRIAATGTTQDLDFLDSDLYVLDASGAALPVNFQQVFGPHDGFGNPPTGIAEAPDGSLVITGRDTVSRYRQDGTRVFGNVDLGPIGGYTQIDGVSVTPDGKVLVAGNGYVERLNLDGSVDTTFGNFGVATVPASDNVLTAVAQPDGRVLAIGKDGAHLAMVRLTNDAAPTTAPVPNSPFALAGTSGTYPTISFYDSATDEAGFVIERATSANGPYTEIARLAAHPGSGGPITYADFAGSAYPGTTYYYRVASVSGPYAGGFVGPVSATAILATPTPTPYGGTPVSLPGKIEAENFDNGGEGVAYHDADAANNGGAYRSGGVDLEATGDAGGGYDVGWTHAGEWMKYSVNVTATGSFTLDVRVANMAAGAAFHIEVDGVNVTGSLAVPNTGAWQSYTDVTKSGINLMAGNHIVTLVMDANAANGFAGNYNWMSFTPTPTPTSTPFSGTPISLEGEIEAENYDKGGEGVAYHDTDTLNQGGTYRSDGVDIESIGGGGYAIDYAHAGEWLDYTVDVAATGTYQLDVAAANAAPGGRFHVEVDGVDVTGSLAVPNTGDWMTYAGVTKGGISLTFGRHVVRLVMDADASDGFTGNFDSMTFSRSPAV